MTWTINMYGHDNLSGEQKEKLEQSLVKEAQDLTDWLREQEGIVVTSATINTNTTGPVTL